jgi:DNA-binding transcriptional LysR family regulator
MSLLASPDYIAAAGAVTHPAQLAHHDVIIDRNKPAPQQLRFVRDGEVQEVRVNGRLTLNGAVAAVAAASAGVGIACSPSWAAEDALADGRLVELLPDWQPEHRDLWAVFPSSRYMTHRVRLFVDHLAKAFAEGI